MELLRRPLSIMTMKLYDAAQQMYPDDNVIISPVAVTGLVAMVWAATEGTHAAKQIKDLLQVDHIMRGQATAEDVLRAFREAFHKLRKYNKRKDDDGESCALPQEFRLHLDSRGYMELDCEIDKDFTEKVQKNLKIEFVRVNFDTDEGRGEIEQWLRSKRAIPPPDLIDPSYHGQRLVIVSAAFFKAGWEVPFDRNLTAKAEFYTKKGKVLADMMNLTSRYPYSVDEDIGVKVIDIPYFRNEISLVITLPTKRIDIDVLQRELTADVYTALHIKKRMKVVKLALPRIKIHSTYPSKKLLNLVGVRSVLNDETPLPSLQTSQADLRISEGVHTCAFQMNEDGSFVSKIDGEDENGKRCSGSDAEGLLKIPTPPGSSSGRKSPEPTQVATSGPVDFICNQPFLLAVRHNKTGAFLFTGRVMRP